jgi:hypothetical protein
MFSHEYLQKERMGPVVSDRDKTDQVDPQWTPAGEHRVIPSLRIVGQYTRSFEAKMLKPDRGEPMHATSFSEGSTKSICIRAFRVQLGARDDRHPAGLSSLLRFPPVAVRIPETTGITTLVQAFPVDLSVAAPRVAKSPPTGLTLNWGLLRESSILAMQRRHHGTELNMGMLRSRIRSGFCSSIPRTHASSSGRRR